MPPWAAFEWERTGWTFERIPTDTPCSAAASAARCPASPAPMTSTSCSGKARASLWDDFQNSPTCGLDALASRRLDPRIHPIATTRQPARNKRVPVRTYRGAAHTDTEDYAEDDQRQACRHHGW